MAIVSSDVGKRTADQGVSALAAARDARAQVAAGLESRLVELRRFHPGKRLVELAVFSGLWVGGAAIVLAARDHLPSGPGQWALRALGTFLAAVGLNAFVLLLHEGMHHTLFERPFWNRWVSVLLGATVLMSFSAYQVMHLRHHTYLGDPRDPDDYHNYSAKRGLVWLMHFFRLLSGAFLYLLLIPFLSLRHGSPVARRRVLVEYSFIALLYLIIALTVPATVIVHGWLIPVVLVGFMTNVRGFTQHGITDAADPFLASRTIRANPVVAFCLLNENFHLEHHLFPEVPSHHLRELHELIWPRLPRAVTGRSYLGFLARFLRATLTLDETPIGRTSPAASHSEPTP
jgi:fatty acid desaturase